MKMEKLPVNTVPQMEAAIGAEENGENNGSDKTPTPSVVMTAAANVSNGAGGGSKQKQRHDDGLILVMEPQNPSPTKYFDSDGLPLRKGVNESHSTSKYQKKRSSNLVIICHNCDRKFETKAEFEVHYRQSYQQEPVYMCRTCDKRIEQYKAYRLHSYRHSNSASQKYSCSVCSKTFHQRSDLIRHENIHVAAPVTPPVAEPIPAPESEKSVPCNRCDAVFENQSQVRTHVKKLHPVPKQVIQCPDCDKYLSAGSLYSHRKIHTDKRQYSCQECDKTFIQKINFMHHRRTHQGDRPYPCQECGKAFYEKSHLQRHQNFHSEERPYRCDSCGKNYKTERCLKVHSAVHNAERPYVCVECNKGFLSSSKLRQHSNIHSGLRPFKCKYCGRDFTNFPNWLKHIRRRHKVDHRTGEKLDSVPKFMTKKKSKVADGGGKRKVTSAHHPVHDNPMTVIVQEVRQSMIKEESLPFVSETSNIDLNLVSKDDLIQTLSGDVEELIGNLPSATKPKEGATDERTNIVSVDDECALFQYDYVQPDFDCDFSIKKEFQQAINRELNLIGGDSSKGAKMSAPETRSSPSKMLLYDGSPELAIFPTLSSIYGLGQQFRLINPNFIHLPPHGHSSNLAGATERLQVKVEMP